MAYTIPGLFRMNMQSSADYSQGVMKYGFYAMRCNVCLTWWLIVRVPCEVVNASIWLLTWFPTEWVGVMSLYLHQQYTSVSGNTSLKCVIHHMKSIGDMLDVCSRTANLRSNQGQLQHWCKYACSNLKVQSKIWRNLQWLLQQWLDLNAQTNNTGKQRKRFRIELHKPSYFRKATISPRMFHKKTFAQR